MVVSHGILIMDSSWQQWWIVLIKIVDHAKTPAHGIQTRISYYMLWLDNCNWWGRFIPVRSLCCSLMATLARTVHWDLSEFSDSSLPVTSHMNKSSERGLTTEEMFRSSANIYSGLIVLLVLLWKGGFTDNVSMCWCGRSLKNHVLSYILVLAHSSLPLRNLEHIHEGYAAVKLGEAL